MRTPRLFSTLILFALVGCSVLQGSPSPTPAQPAALETGLPQLAAPPPPPPDTLVEFRVEAPENTPPEDTIYLTILDEVTGLALNAEAIPMPSIDPATGLTVTMPSRTHAVRLPFPVGSTITYRYERQAGSIRVAEHLSNGAAVRYRIYQVSASGAVSDIVSRWTDTPYQAVSGRIAGQVLDASNDQPIPNLLVTAGGAQTYTNSQGKYLIEGLPPGVHNLAAYALNGAYRLYQQGAQVSAESLTPADLRLEPAQTVKVMFVVKTPPETPPVVPLRLAGNLIQLGNSFATLSGGASSQAANMPALSPLPDGRYAVTLSLPAGADIRYKYTLGDGFWNAEHTSEGKFRLRQLIVPGETVLVEDTIDTWYDDAPNALTFDVGVPANTPSEDFVSLQLNPLFGWMEPIPMWSFGSNRWAYILFSPLKLPGNLSYRYCRNGQCGRADDTQTPGLYGAGRPAQLGEPQGFKDQVEAWVDWGAELSAFTILTPTISNDKSIFLAGIEFQPDYHPSWQARFPSALDNVQQMGANGLILSPTWSFTRSAPPLIEPVAGQDASWYDLLDLCRQANEKNFHLALHPTPHFPAAQSSDEWWQSAPRDLSWWLGWFDQYRTFILNYADLAQRCDAAGIILGGEWLRPALPGGHLADGSPSGVPADTEARWLQLFEETRQHFDGQILWALPYDDLRSTPAFIDVVDQIYLLWPAEIPAGADSLVLQNDIAYKLDIVVWPIQILSGKPLILAASYPSASGMPEASDTQAAPDMQAQVNAYQALLSAASQRFWISGVVARGYYPPVALQDGSASVHGKAASLLFAAWFPRLWETVLSEPAGSTTPTP